MDMATQRGYSLAPHIFSRYVDGHCLVLDLRQDNYMLLDDGTAEALRYLLHEDTRNAPIPSTIEAQIEPLIEKGLLVRGPANDEMHLGEHPDQAKLDLKGWPHDGLPTIRIGHVFNCFRAFVRAKYMRRFYSMEKMVFYMAARKQRGRARASNTSVSIDRVRELVEIHRILRGIFYTAKNYCLFDSLTLTVFLSYYRIYPSWVFAVQMGPFEAHSWVQDDKFIYNDAIDHTSAFQPIMSV